MILSEHCPDEARFRRRKALASQLSAAVPVRYRPAVVAIPRMLSYFEIIPG